MERFHVPYNLKAIPEVHEYLHASFEHAKTKNDLHDLYRRRLVLPSRFCCERVMLMQIFNSRLLEPKRPADATPTDGRALFPWISRTNSANPAAGTA
jgi:son of sevenless-like protein